jgi:hypothetical protein
MVCVLACALDTCLLNDRQTLLRNQKNPIRIHAYRMEKLVAPVK